MAEGYKLQVLLQGDDRQLKATLERTIKDIQAIAQAAGKAVQPIEQMGNAAAKLRGIEMLQRLAADIQATEQALKTAKREFDFFTEGAKKAGDKASVFALDIERAQTAAGKLGLALSQQRGAYAQLATVLQQAGINTRDLASATDALGREQADAAQAAEAEKQAIAAAAEAEKQAAITREQRMRREAELGAERIRKLLEYINLQKQEAANEKQRDRATGGAAVARIQRTTQLLNEQVAAAGRAREAFNQLTAAYQRSEGKNVRPGVSLAPVAAQAMRGEVATLAAMTAATTPAVREMERLRTAFAGAGEAAQKHGIAFNLMTGQVYGLIGAYVSLRGVWLGLVDTFKQGTQLQVLNASLKFATGNAETAAKEFAFLRAETDRLGISFDSAVMQYSQLAAATRGTSLEGKRTRDIFLGIAEAARAAGLANEQVEGTLRAVTQIASKGIVQYEELRGQLGDRLPAALRIAAQAMGVTQGQLTSMIQAGKVTAEDFLPKFAAALRNDAAPALDEATKTGVAALARLENAFRRLQRAFADSGLTRELVGIFDQLANSMDEANGKARSLGSEFASAMRALYETLKQVANATSEWWGEIKELALALIGFKVITAVTGWLKDLVLWIERVVAAFLAGTVAAAGFGRALGFLATATAGIVAAEFAKLYFELQRLEQELEQLAKKKENFYAERQKIVAEKKADFQAPNAETLEASSNAELRALQKKADDAEQHWRAQTELEEKNLKNATEASRERLRLARSELAKVSEVLNRRLEIEKNSNALLDTERKTAIKKLQDDLNNAYTAYKSYNDRVGKLLDEAKAFGDKTKEIRERINEPATDLTKGTVLEPIGQIGRAKEALREGDYERARKLAEKAADAVDEIAESGKATKYYLNSLLDQIREVYNEATAGEQAALEGAASAAEAQMTELVAKIKLLAQPLESLPIGFDTETALANAQALRDQIQAIMNTIVVPVGAAPVSDINAALKSAEPQVIGGQASGGLISGPGTGTSDSILARLSNGEFVMRAAAVQKYGAGLLERLNNLRMPRFAMGGLVAPQVPAFASGGPVGTPVNIYLPGGESFGMSAAPSVAKAMSRVLGLEVLKRGRR